MSDWFAPSAPIYGNDCLHCYPAGLTPKHYYAAIAGVDFGDLWLPAMGPPPNGLHFLTQTVPNPCAWEDPIGGNVIVVYFSDGVKCELQANKLPYVPGFLSQVAVKCVRYHTNDYDIPAGNFYYGGYAYIFTPTEIQELIEGLTPVVDPDPLLRVDPMANSELILSYIDEWGDTKVKMKVDIS